MNNLFEYKDGKLLWKTSRSNVIAIGQEAGTQYARGYRRVYFDGKTHGVHRVIWQMFNGDIPDGMQVDHIDGCPENNKIENLRLVTSEENAMNRIHKGKIKHVSMCAKNGKYKVSLQAKGRRIFCGYFEDLELADLVAAEARQKYHGIYTRGAV
jgi:hypothetical protein